LGTLIEQLLHSAAKCPGPTLPLAIATVIGTFAPLLSGRIFAHAKLLIIGAVLAPGQRTITAVLSVMGRGDNEHFYDYHRVLNRDRWLPRDASHLLLRQM
jgi:hypothetical protein